MLTNIDVKEIVEWKRQILIETIFINLINAINHLPININTKQMKELDIKILNILNK